MNRLRVGKLVFRDPVLLCGVVYLPLYLLLHVAAATLHFQANTSSRVESQAINMYYSTKSCTNS